MKLSYKYRLYPNKEQAAILRSNFSFCCFLYNCALEERNSFYKTYGTGLSYNIQAGELPADCGNIKTDLTLKDREYHCEACDLAIDRDVNAAINIKRLGMSLATG
ncbi:MAG: helix-turn-helix domain-containing protein [Candidatus Omnitrophica bacterium]|nr:helix-turn-helix domain-containing protein [Candidatus Omnitrophota bacterium]